MDRRTLLTAMGGLSLLGHTGLGIARTKIRPLVGIITFRGATDVEKGFKSYLSTTGLDPEYAEFDIARDKTLIPGILDSLRERKPDLVLTWGTSVTQAVAGTIEKPNPNVLPCPTVFALVTAPVPSGIVESLNGSKRPVTGVYHVATPDQQIQAIEQYSPIKKLGMIYTPTENNSIVTLDLMRSRLAKRGLELVAVPVDLNSDGKPTADTITDKVAEIAKAGANWLYLPPDSFVGSNAKDKVIPAAHALGLPTFATTEQLMKAGSLLGLVCSYFEIGQFAGFKAMQILRNGTFAGKIPVETLQTYSLRINPEQARALNMTPPLPLFGVAKFQTAG